MCYDGDPPAVFERVVRIARKEHRCTECLCVIGRGEKYHRSWGIWNGEVSTFSVCALCHEKCEMIARHEYAMGCAGSEAYPPFGEVCSEYARLCNQGYEE